MTRLAEQGRCDSVEQRSQVMVLIVFVCIGSERFGFKLVFDLRTAGSNLTSPNSAIGILLWLGFIFLIVFSNSKPFRQCLCQGFANCVTAHGQRRMRFKVRIGQAQKFERAKNRPALDSTDRILNVQRFIPYLG